MRPAIPGPTPGLGLCKLRKLHMGGVETRRARPGHTTLGGAYRLAEQPSTPVRIRRVLLGNTS